MPAPVRLLFFPPEHLVALKDRLNVLNVLDRNGIAVAMEANVHQEISVTLMVAALAPTADSISPGYAVKYSTDPKGSKVSVVTATADLPILIRQSIEPPATRTL